MMQSENLNNLINKYGLLDNKSNKICKLVFDKIIATKTIKLKSIREKNYGFVTFDVKNANLQIYYNDILFAVLSGNEFKVFYCIFNDGDNIQIKGECDELIVGISGAEVTNKNKFYSIPSLKYIVKDRGDITILSYENSEDIENNNLTQIKTIKDCVDFRPFVVDSESYISYLTLSSGDLYLYTSIDNYTTKKLIESNVSDAIFLPGNSDGNKYIAYIKDGGVYYKKLSYDLETIGLEYSIDTNNNVAKCFSEIENESGAINYLGVNFFDGSMQLYVFNNTKFSKILIKKADYSKLRVNGSNIEVICIVDYSVNVSKFKLNSNFETVQVGDVLYLNNVDDIVKIGDLYLAYSNGFVNVVDYDNN